MNKILARMILGAATGTGIALAKRGVENFFAGRALRHARDVEARNQAAIDELRPGAQRDPKNQAAIERLEREIQNAYDLAGARNPRASGESDRAARRASVREARAKALPRGGA